MEYPKAPFCHLLCSHLFTVNTIYLPSASKVCKLESYVLDDSEVLFPLPLTSLDTSLSYIKDDLLKIAKWCFENSFLINPSKTKMLLIGTRQLLQQLTTIPSIDFLRERLLPVQSVTLISVDYF